MAMEGNQMTRSIEILEGRIKELEAALRYIIDIHHRTMKSSSFHDPENREWTECDCLTCKKVQALLPLG
jgi:hypothetical protein